MRGLRMVRAAVALLVALTLAGCGFFFGEPGDPFIDVTVEDEADVEAVFEVVTDHAGVAEANQGGRDISARFEADGSASDFAALVVKLEDDPRVKTVTVGILSNGAR